MTTIGELHESMVNTGQDMLSNLVQLLTLSLEEAQTEALGILSVQLIEGGNVSGAILHTLLHKVSLYLGKDELDQLDTVVREKWVYLCVKHVHRGQLDIDGVLLQELRLVVLGCPFWKGV